MRTKLVIAAALSAVSYLSALPAMADHWHDDHHDGHYNDRHDDHHDDHHDWNDHKRAEIRQDIRQQQHINNVVQRRQYRDWNEERNHYQNSLRKLTWQQQRVYDAEMRRQWLAYHHGSWNGPNSWNNYSDPGFLNYLHSNQPGLWSRIGGAFGL